jgi:hypothetical protein
MCCGGKGNKYEIYVIIDGKEYKIGPRPLYMFLRGIADNYQNDTEYNFEQVNKKTGGKISGKLVFVRGIPFVDGRRLL